MATRSKKFWWILAALVVVAAVLIWKFKPNNKEEATSVKVETVATRTIFSRVVESGSIQPTIEVPVAPDVSGEVVELLVREGQVVKKGQLLMTIRPDSYQAALEQAQASLNGAKADYMQAQGNQQQLAVSMKQDSISLARTRQLYSEQVISKVEVENAELKYNLSKSQYEAAKFTVQAAFYRSKSAEASLNQSKQNLNRTNIYASMDGTITQLNVELGQRVLGTMQMAGTEVLKIADLSNMEVVVKINENDIVNIEMGDSAMVEVDAYPNKKFYGNVAEIAYSADKTALGTTDQVTNFEVSIRLNPASYADLMVGKKVTDSPFRPGMSALVEIYTEKVENALAVPIQAITLTRPKVEKKQGWGPPKPEESTDKEAETQLAQASGDRKQIVFIEEGGKVRQSFVKTGINDDAYIQVSEGVKVGDKVVIGPYSTLSKTLQDSMKVVVE